MQSMMTDSFNSFKKANGIFPQRLICFREGVGEGNKKSLMEQEIPQIHAAINSIPDMKGNCKLVYTLVNTKVKTKLIRNEQNRLQNPVPGTVLDHTITKKDVNEFYLVSTNCRQGVPSPAHYSVLVDEIDNGPEKIQELAYKQSYLYYNFSGAVKIPAPIKYAYRLATMVGERGNTMPH